MAADAKDTLGIYLSIPFCRAKCSFCNFASGVFAAGKMQGYVDRLCAEMRAARADAKALGAAIPSRVDSVYFGGGTPSLLEPALVRQLFAALHGEFDVSADAEVTLECAPGQMTDDTLAALQQEGMNRLSFGVQSFVDGECAAVGRLHTGEDCRQEVRRMDKAGVGRLALDLIVGLPRQTEESWRYTIDEALATGVEHISLYMLEVDEDSRLGREVMTGGRRYGAGELPSEDRIADWYERGCEWLTAAGVKQYEISNFARESGQSRHNRKYWERAPYLGFGMDAHTMLRAREGDEMVRWANPDEMGRYLGGGLVVLGASRSRGSAEREIAWVNERERFEEALFLGLRLLEGVAPDRLREEFSEGLLMELEQALVEVEGAGLLERTEGWIRLTGRGRLVSNEVFSRLLLEPAA